jgi:hypothetical protein
VCEPVHLVLDVELCNSEPVEIAVTPVEPPATAAAKLCKSVFSAEIIAIASPADLADVDDIDMLVWFATLSIAVNKEFHCEALTVSPALTVETADCPSPYTPEPVPMMWLIP